MSFLSLPWAALLAAALALPSVPPAPASIQAAPSDSSDVRLYVPNQRGASISVLDGAGRALTTVDLTEHGFSDHAMPHEVVVSPTTGAWYVTLAGDGYVAMFDRDNQLVKRTQFEAPGMIGVDHTRNRVYVSRSLSAVSPPKSLGVFRASDLELLEEPYIFISRPHALSIDSVSGRVYSASLDGSQIAGLDHTTDEVEIARVDDMSGGFVGLDSSPDGTRLVATTQQTAQLLAFDSHSLALEQIAAVPVEPGPYDVRFSPDGQSVWFPNQTANTVTKVDARSWEVAAVVRSHAFVRPHGVAISPDSRVVYVTSHGMEALRARPENGTLTLIRGSDGTVRQVTAVGPFAAALGRTVVR